MTRLVVPVADVNAHDLRRRVMGMGEATVKIECPRTAPPCAYSFERFTRYEALMDLAEHLHVVHGVQRSQAMMLALTAPDPA